MASVPEGAVGLEHDVRLHTRLEQPDPVLVRAELHLIDSRSDLGRLQQRRQLVAREVRDPDRARVSGLVGSLHAGPGPGRAACRPVDEVQVDVVEFQPGQASLELDRRIRARGTELGRHEHLLPRDLAASKRTADALLVAVRLRGVDVAVSGLQRPADRVLAGPAVADLPDAEAEHRHPVAVIQTSGPAVGRQLMAGQLDLLDGIDSR